jgi:transmembrane sensor
MPALDRQAMEQAAQWFVLLASGEASDADRGRWHAWRSAHPAHEQAWQRAEGSTARFADIPQDQATASLHALHRAPALKSGSRRKGLAQLAVLLATGFGGWQGYRTSDWSADLITAVGEQRETTLADGSRLVLDTGSAVDIAFTAERRLIRLRRGRIMIASAPDPAPRARPLMVETAEGRVRALGTRFTVQQETQSTRVTVLEARVAVHARHTTGDDAILSAGQAARFDRGGVIERLAAPATDAAWLQGMLIADDMRLADLVAQLARYRPEPLACDPSAAALRISGAFPLRDTERTLVAIGHTLPVRLERRIHADGRTGLLIRRK